MISVSENFLGESEWFCFTKYDLSLPKTRYVYLRWSFLVIAWPVGLYMNGELTQVHSDFRLEIVNIEIIVVIYFG
jgi:hypothetical protein